MLFGVVWCGVVWCGVVWRGVLAEYLVQAVEQGLLTLEDVAASGTRFLTVVISTGHFDGPDACAYTSYGPDVVDTPANRWVGCLGVVVPVRV